MDKLTGRNHATLRAVMAIALSVCCGAACSSDDEGEGMLPATVAGMGGASGGAGGAGGASGVGGAGGVSGMNAGAGGAGGVAGVGGASGMTGGAGGMMAAGAGGMMAAGAGGMMAGTSGGMDAAGAGGMGGGPIGPEDGDSTQPIVAVPDVECGGPSGGFGLGSPNFQLGGRDMIVTYPCEKHGGAPVTFILNLHGTTPVAQHFYQHGYFAVHEYAASHNFIVVTPSSVVQQWGNGDDGQDEPHLLEIIDWVYANLGGEGKFDIRGMWVGGHSWGGLYTARFGCSDAIADKVKGLILMSGGGISGFSGAACADRVAAVITTAEGDGRMPGDQADLATSHGCDAAASEMILQNEHTHWDNCDPGFVHANYYMLGKEHATFMDDEVVKSIADWIKLSRI